MDTYIALLRGINVGGKHMLPMPELVAILETLGLSQIKAYIQSGNVVFQGSNCDRADLAQQISAAIAHRYGFVAPVLILDRHEFSAAIVANPFPEAAAAPNTLHCFFLAALPEHPNLSTLETLKQADEQFSLINQVFYLYAPAGIGCSKLATQVEKTLGVAATARNWRTVNKIMEMVE